MQQKTRSCKARVKALKELPQIEQKSEEWYNMRRNMITASDFAQALGEGKFGTQKQLIEKKVMPRENENQISQTNPFFKWGHMFEPVACSIYQKMKKVIVHEFGLLQHPKYPFFGASPDGITDDGVMLEIKCPMKRKLTGDIPTQYFYQIQGQLDVCGLNVCDYFECTFEFVEDYPKWVEINDKIKGVFRDVEGGYEYQDPFLVGENCDAVWKGEKCKYWVLSEYNLQTVSRDKEFMKGKIKELKKVWEKIEFYRKNQTAFEIEVMQAIDIETERLKPPSIKLKELQTTDKYMFLD